LIINVLVTIIILLIASFYDLKKKTIPGKIIFPFLLIGFLHLLISIPFFYGDGILRYSQLIFACSFLVVGWILVEKKIVGGGDILLLLGIIMITPINFFTIDYFLGLFFFSSLCGVAYYGIIQYITPEKIKDIKFVPAILIGYLVVTIGLYGAEILPCCLI
jgi:prepilin signal peptidase PulO-like enzyme (type II secretory pathway)